MTLDDLIASFRTDADDATAQAVLWSDANITRWLNEAVAEACIRGRLIHESGNAAVCRIAIAAGTAQYPLHPSLYEIDAMGFQRTGDTRRDRITRTSREELDRTRPDWRWSTGCTELCAIQSDRSIRLVPVPENAGILYIEGYRTPLVDLEDGDDTPEINGAHHRHLVHWALHRAFSVPDSEFIDKDRAALAERSFTGYFGMRPDADLRRMSQIDQPQHNQAFWV